MSKPDQDNQVLMVTWGGLSLVGTILTYRHQVDGQGAAGVVILFLLCFFISAFVAWMSLPIWWFLIVRPMVRTWRRLADRRRKKDAGKS